jgi:hypothetical protein
MPGTNFGAPPGAAVQVQLTNEAGLAVFVTTVGVPPATAGLYAPGALIISDNGNNYINSGTSAAPIITLDSGGATPQVATVALSSAQILALNATPVTLVAAQGATKVISVLSIVFKMIATATAYANGGAVEFRYTNAAGAKVSADVAAAVVTAGAGTTITTVSGIGATGVLNAPIVVDNATAPFITGTGTATVTITYQVLTP